MNTLINENLIGLIFRSFSLYDLQAHFDKLKNKTINEIRLKIVSYDKIFITMGRPKVILAKVNKNIFPPVVLPNGNLISASQDGTIQFWNIKRGLCTKTLTAEDRIYRFTVLQSGNIMVYLYNGKFQIWKDYGEGPTRTIEVKGYSTFSNILFLSNGDITCCDRKSSLIILYFEDNYQSTKILNRREEGYIKEIRQITNNLFYYLCEMPDSLQIYDIQDYYKCIFMMEEQLRPIIWTNNILLGVIGVDIMVLDTLNEYKCLHCLKGHIERVADLLYIDKNQLLLSGSYDYTIKVWDANNNFNCIRTIDTGSYWVDEFLILKNGYFATIFCGDNKIRIWDLISVKCVNTLEHDFSPTYIKLLEDNRILSYSCRGNILVWSY
jgi:WD40 repeat protein